MCQQKEKCGFSGWYGFKFMILFLFLTFFFQNFDKKTCLYGPSKSARRARYRFKISEQPASMKFNISRPLVLDITMYWLIHPFTVKNITFVLQLC